VKRKIVCIGTLVVDIFVQGIKGSVGPDTGFQSGIEHHAGGNALNVAVGLAKLGAEKGSVICGGIAGNDIFGALFESYFKKYGVAARIKKIKNRRSAKCIIIGFSKKGRAFIGDRGVNGLYSADEAIGLINSARPHIFYAGETSSLPAVDRALGKILRHSAAAGAINVVDCIITDAGYKSKISGYGRFIDVLHVNDREAGILTGKTDMREALRVFAGHGVKLVFISSGGGPLLFSYNGAEYRMPVFPVNCADPTGAGDAFTAAVINALSRLKGTGLGEKLAIEKNLLNTALYAQAAGAAAVTRIGCTDGVSRTAVNTFLKKHGNKLLKGVKKRRV